MALHGEEAELSSRRFSASCIRSFQEDHKSTTNFTSSSCVSSPRYSLKGEIDPLTYSFTSALKALQAKTVCKKEWDWFKQEGVELNSKWNEAEKYICNPLSGEVPMECLSSKTLNSRSFRNFSTMILPSNHNPITIIPTVKIIQEDHISPIQEKKVMGLKRDVGVQSPQVNVGQPIMEKRQVEADDSREEYALKLKTQQHEEDVKLEKEKQNMITKENEEDNKEKDKRGSGCLSWMRKRQSKSTKPKCYFSHLIKACSTSNQ